MILSEPNTIAACALTSFGLAPRSFLPFFSNSRRCSRSSLNHRSATPYNALLCSVAFSSPNGHGVGSVTKDPSRMCPTWVGKLPKPSNMWVASVRGDIILHNVTVRDISLTKNRRTTFFAISLQEGQQIVSHHNIQINSDLMFVVCVRDVYP